MAMENKKRLIDIEQAKRATYEEIFWTESEQAVVRNFLAKLPKVDAVEVVHGRWIPLDECANAGVYCSVCHKKVYKECYANVEVKSNYCPNCGAKMDGGNDDG